MERDSNRSLEDSRSLQHSSIPFPKTQARPSGKAFHRVARQHSLNATVSSDDLTAGTFTVKAAYTESEIGLLTNGQPPSHSERR